MKKLVAKMVLAMALGFVMALLVNLHAGVVLAKQADPGAAVQRQEPEKPIRVQGTVRGTMRRPASDIVVVYPEARSLHVRGIGGMFHVAWTFQGSASYENRRDFRVKLMKHSNRSWSVDLGSSRISVSARNQYTRHWNIPAGFTIGDDFFFRVIHIPTGQAAHSPFFSIVARPGE